MKSNIKHIIKDILLKEEFDVGGAFDFIEDKTGRGKPDVYIQKLIKTAPEKLDLKKDLRNQSLIDLYNIIYHPEKMASKTVYTDIDLSDSNIERLPEGITFRGDLEIKRCPNIRVIQDGITVDGWFNAEDCMSLKSIESTGVKGWVNLFRSGIESLPDNWRVGNLDLRGCYGITKLPDNLHVNGSLFCENSNIKKIGKNIRIIHNFDLRGTPLGNRLRELSATKKSFEVVRDFSKKYNLECYMINF